MRSATHSCFLTLNLGRKVMHKLLDISRNAKMQVTAVSGRVFGQFCRKTSSFDNCTKCYWPIVKMWKYKLKRLHTISRKLDYKTALTKKWWKLQAVHLPANMWKLHPVLKTKIEFRAIGHWGQKRSASCLLHFLLATLLLATWPMPQLFQLNDLMQRYSTQQIWPTQFILTQQYMSCKSHPSR